MSGNHEIQAVPVTKRIQYIGCMVQVQKRPEGGKVIQIIDSASGTSHEIPLEPQGCREIGGKLLGGVDVAGPEQMPRG